MSQSKSNEQGPSDSKPDQSECHKDPSSTKPELNALESDAPKQTDNQFPVTWLPAMVVSSENPSPFIIDSQMDKIHHDIVPPGTVVQLPQSYGHDSKIFGIVLGPNTVIPLDSLSLVNLSGFGKISMPNVSESDGVNLGDAAQGMPKMESVDGSTQETSYQNISAETGDKDHLFCIYCHKYLKSVNELHNHMLIEHTEQSGMGFMSDGSIPSSLQMCPGCGHQLRKVNPYESEFHTLSTSHEDDQNINLTQSGNILMVCDHCCKEFTLALTTDTSQQNVPVTPKRHFCDHCDKSYKHNRDLRKHLRTHHGIENSSSHSLSSSYSTVPIQNVSFQTESTSATNKMICDKCKKMFRGPFELRRHTLTVHENKRPYKCQECSKLFRDAYELKRHAASHQRVHFHTVGHSNVPQEGSSSLEMLRLQNANQNDSSTHIQSVDQLPSGGVLRDVYSIQPGTPMTPPPTGVDYYCGTCEKNFRGANEFKRHYSVVHEKKYRYKCIHCGKLWRDQYDLKRHCRRSHFVDREIDRAFIRQCLLDPNNDSNVAPQQSINLSNYDINPQVTLALNQEVANAIFGASEDIRSSSNQMDQFAMVDHNSLNIARGSPTSSLFQNLPSIQPASMLYHSTGDPSHLVENILPSHDSDSIKEESKNAVSWSNFESDIQASPK